MLPLVRVGADVSAHVVTSTRLFEIAVPDYKVGFRPPARKGHPVQAIEHGGHTAASTVVTLNEEGSLSLHVLHRFDVLLCGQVPYRRRILHDWPDKRLVT